MLPLFKLISVLPPAILFVTAQFISAWAAEGDRLEVTATKSAWLRSQPDRNSRAVVALGRGQQLLELGRKDSWVHVETPELPSRRGWVHASLVDITPNIRSTRACQGHEKDFKTGGDDNVAWESTSRVMTDDDFCFERTVVIKSPSGKYLVNWPKANFHNVVVNKELALPAAKYENSIPTPEDLEYGYFNQKIPTTVYRGHDEPILHSLSTGGSFRFAAHLPQLQNWPTLLHLVQDQAGSELPSPELPYDEKWISVFGSVYAGDALVYLALTFRSGFRDISEGRGLLFEYFYNIVNEGDEVTMEWSASGSEVFSNYLRENAIDHPIRAAGKEFVLNANGTSSGKPLQEDTVIEITSIDGQQAMKLIAPAYVPGQQ